jgi:hypothetical protein
MSVRFAPIQACSSTDAQRGQATTIEDKGFYILPSDLLRMSDRVLGTTRT